MKLRPRNYGFQEELDFSNGFAPDPDDVLPFLKYRIPNFKRVRKAPVVNDRTGIDYYVERFHLPSLAFDLKLRREDWTRKDPEFAKDDLALETFSVVENGKVGWTRDPNKAADYILWFWRDSGRFFIVPFPALCYVFQKMWVQWREQYGAVQQYTTDGSGWHSECVFVPREVVMEYINRWSNGQTKPLIKKAI